MTSRDDLPPNDAEGEVPLTPEEEASFAEALRAALEPRELDVGVHERILQRALHDPLAPASSEERAEAERLRDALEGRGESEFAALAEALRVATQAPKPELAQAAHERALDSALPRRSNVIWAAFGAVGGALALAAAFALVVTPLRKEGAPAPQRSAELARSRSLAPLLNNEAPRLSPSERMDRIASVRERDLRKNRYARWGVP
ncbi:MAG: hypothetical protein ACOY0T_10805 [Myxococcota bacterium]